MKTTDIKPFLQDERGHTDHSLTTERGKTDESLFELRKKTEVETDAKVKVDREEADFARAQSRTEKDSVTEANELVTDQREFDDSTMRAERSSMDAAIRRERKQKEAVLSRFLHEERQDTDGNLREERKQTDAHFESSLQELTDETTLHLKTKADLTSREDFLAIVSHDLRNPIGAVLSCTDMLLEDPTFLGPNADSKYWIQFIKRNAESSLRLISDILDMERIAQGKLELRLTTDDLSSLVYDAVEGLSYSAATKGVVLKTIPTSQNFFASYDTDRILQVLQNLISNAIKFTPEHGLIQVSLHNRGGDMIRICVKDNGPGVAEDRKESIFERFAQINNKDRRGLGLGLYISKTLVEAHGGKLSLESTVGQGSTFYIDLPVSRVQANQI